MPSVGIPCSNTAGSIRGAPSEYTDAGPPERIRADGLCRRISSTLARYDTSSEYTRASRTRRAISCEYWPPRSTTRTGRSSAASVIRGVLGDRDIVRVRLAQPCPRDAHEARFLHRVDRRRAAIAHRLAEPAD